MYRKRRFGQRLKKWSCCLLIMVLLPYVITVFINGSSFVSVSSSNVDDTYVNVETETGTVQLPIEEYCIGILAKEIPPDYEMEALRAQAVLVRTDIYAKIQASGSEGLLKETFWTQKKMQDAWGMGNYYKNYGRFKEAWESTEGQVLTYEEKLAKTPFFRLSNGSTRDGKEAVGEGYPYLKIVECPKDIESPKQIRTVTVDEVDAEVTKCDSAGYVSSVRVGKETINGEEFRSTYGLVSSCYTLQKYNGKLRITTRGIGHGIGLSQNTANEMAKDKKKYEEILKYFFEGTELKEVSQIVQSEKNGAK